MNKRRNTSQEAMEDASLKALDILTNPLKPKSTSQDYEYVDEDRDKRVQEVGYDYLEEPDFLASWDVVSNSGSVARRKYIELEIQRMIDEGKPLSRAIIKLDNDAAKTEVLTVIDELGLLRTVRLRLVPGCKDRLPTEDTAHRVPLPEKDKGSMLVVKIGNRGGELQNANRGVSSEITKHFLGPARSRDIKQYRRNPADKSKREYRTAAITFEPYDFDRQTAFTVLLNWGYGIALNPDKEFVVEVPTTSRVE